MNKKLNEYDIAKDMMSRIRSINESKKQRLSKKKDLLLESDSKTEDAIAITNDPKFGDNVLQNQINSFKQTVHGGAKFGDENKENAKNNPLVFFPSDGNLVFSGSIPSLADLKFQFSLNDITDSPYIFVDGLALTDETVTTLNKLRGFYKNWKDEWFAAGDLLDRLRKEDK